MSLGFRFIEANNAVTVASIVALFPLPFANTADLRSFYNALVNQRICSTTSAPVIPAFIPTCAAAVETPTT